MIASPPTQPTPRHLIRLLLAYKNLPTDNDTIRDYQRRKWGAADGETAVIGLSAIAANSFSTERADREHFRGMRIKAIRDRIHAYKPAFVVVYGLTNTQNCEQLVQGKFDPEGFASLGHTVVSLAKHPAGGKPAEPDLYRIRLGRELRRRCIEKC